MGTGLLVSTVVLVVICIIGGYFYYNKSTSNSSSTSCPPANQEACGIGEQCASTGQICASGQMCCGTGQCTGGGSNSLLSYNIQNDFSDLLSDFSTNFNELYNFWACPQNPKPPHMPCTGSVIKNFDPNENDLTDVEMYLVGDGKLNAYNNSTQLGCYHYQQPDIKDDDSLWIWGYVNDNVPKLLPTDCSLPYSYTDLVLTTFPALLSRAVNRAPFIRNPPIGTSDCHPPDLIYGWCDYKSCSYTDNTGKTYKITPDDIGDGNTLGYISYSVMVQHLYHHFHNIVCPTFNEFNGIMLKLKADFCMANKGETLAPEKFRRLLKYYSPQTNTLNTSENKSILYISGMRFIDGLKTAYRIISGITRTLCTYVLRSYGNTNEQNLFVLPTVQEMQQYYNDIMEMLYKYKCLEIMVTRASDSLTNLVDISLGYSTYPPQQPTANKQ